MICLKSKPSQKFLWLLYTKQRKKSYRKKSFLKKRESGGVNKKKKTKRFSLTALTTVIKEDPTTSIRKHANELKVHKKFKDNN